MHVQSGRRSDAGHRLRQQEGQRDREEALQNSRAHDGTRLYRTSGPPAGRVVHEGEADQLTKGRIADMNIIDGSVEKLGEPAAKATLAQGRAWASKGWL